MLVAISHEGTTKLTLEAVQAWEGEKCDRHRSPGEPDRGRVRSRGRRCAGDREELVPHGELHVGGRRARGAPGPRHLGASGGCRGGARAARARHRARAFPDRRRRQRLADGAGGGAQASRGGVRGGRGAPAQSSSSTATSPGSTRRCARRARGRGPGRRAGTRRACGAAPKLGRRRRSSRRGTRVVDIVRFQLLTLALAEKRGVNPDDIPHRRPALEAARGVPPNPLRRLRRRSLPAAPVPAASEVSAASEVAAAEVAEPAGLGFRRERGAGEEPPAARPNRNAARLVVGRGIQNGRRRPSTVI